MRVLQIVHGFPREFVAGTETYCETLSRHLLARGYECVVLAGSSQRATKATLVTEAQDRLLVTRYLRAEGWARSWRDEYDPEAEALIRGLLSLGQPDLVHIHHWLSLTSNLVAICAEMGIPVVVTLHDVWTSCPRVHRIRWDGSYCPEPLDAAPCPTCLDRDQWSDDQDTAGALALRREMMKTELALADAIIVPSEAHRALLLSLLDLPQERLVVLPHGSMSTVAPNEAKQGQSTFPNRPLQIGHWGYLVYSKGTHLILEATHRLRDPSAIQLHLIGTTVEQEYEQRLRELACDISVQFHGAYRPTDLQAFDLDLAVFASITSESYSFVLDEALRLGLPVLVPDRGAFAERIGRAGLTFRAGDVEHLAQRLQEILDAPKVLEAMRRSIRSDTFFSTEAHVAMLEKIYEDATRTHKPKRESVTPYLKLIAYAQQQVREREGILADFQSRLALAEQRKAEWAQLQTEFAALNQSCQATEARNAELAARLAAQEATAATLIQEREAEAQARLLAQQQADELSNRLGSLENAHLMQLQETNRVVGALEAKCDRLTLRLVDIEKTPAARLQALLAKLNRSKKAE